MGYNNPIAGCRIRDKAHHIKERFPDDRHTIDLLMMQDPDFCAICEDHDACVNALNYWIDSDAPEADLRVGEYRTLIKDLEKEAAQAIGALKNRLNRREI